MARSVNNTGTKWNTCPLRRAEDDLRRTCPFYFFRRNSSKIIKRNSNRHRKKNVFPYFRANVQMSTLKLLIYKLAVQRDSLYHSDMCEYAIAQTLDEILQLVFNFRTGANRVMWNQFSRQRNAIRYRPSQGLNVALCSSLFVFSDVVSDCWHISCGESFRLSTNRCYAGCDQWTEAKQRLDTGIKHPLGVRFIHLFISSKPLPELQAILITLVGNGGEGPVRLPTV